MIANERRGALISVVDVAAARIPYHCCDAWNINAFGRYRSALM
jgi:hypothetical protein